MLSTQEATPRATILVVADSPDMLRYLRMVLELDSYRVETANNGVEALQRVRNGTVPEVVVLDLQMPEMDGLKTLGRLLKLQPQLKVIMCSGVDDPDQVQQAALLGARAYLKKPVQHLYLSAAVKECLGLGPDIQIGDNGAELIRIWRRRSLSPVCRPKSSVVGSGSGTLQNGFSGDVYSIPICPARGVPIAPTIARQNGLWFGRGSFR